MSFPAPTEKQAHIIWSGLSILSVALSLAVIGGVFYALASLLSYLSPVLMPIAVAGILACLLDPAVCFFERLHIPRVRSVLLVYLITGGFLVALIGTVIPAAYVQAVGLIGDAQARYAEFRRSHPPSKTRPDETATLPSLENDASISNNVALVPQMSANNEPLPTEPLPPSTRGWIDRTTQRLKVLWNDPRYRQHVEGIENGLKTALTKVGDWLFHQVIAVTHLLGWVIGIVLIPVYIFYFLQSKEGIQRNWKDYLPIHHESEFRHDFVFIVNSISDAMLVFFRGQILVGIISGVLLAVGLSLQGVKYSVLIGVLASVLGVVPYLGFLLSVGLAIGVSAAQFGTGPQVMITTGICLAVHWAEGFGYQPRIIGDRVGLHPMVIIVSLFLGASLLGGLLGGLLGIPLAALVRTLMKRYVWVKYRHEVEPTAVDAAAP